MINQIGDGEEKDLKECPFCEGESILMSGSFFRCSAYVICKSCGARTMEHTSNSMKDAKLMARVSWNRRKGGMKND